MNYIDVCSGVSAPTLAWRELGWRALVYSDIETAARAVLRHRFPDVPLHGRDRRKGEKLEDYAREAGFQTIEGNEYGAADLIVGGTPCQSFSIAGLRKGMDDERGNLALEYVRLARRSRTRWVVWENVPGVFTSSGGEDFRCFLSGLAGWDVPIPAGGWKNSGIIESAPGDLTWGLAWRVLDAQHFGVPQRRRRVIVVGHLGDWRRAAAVLFERASLQGHPPPRREKGTSVAALTANGVGTCGADDNQDQAGHLLADNSRRIFPTLDTAMDKKFGSNQWTDSGQFVIETAHTLRGEGFDASEDGTGRGTPLVSVQCFDATQRDVCQYGDMAGTLGTEGGAAQAIYAIQERAVSENGECGPDGTGVRGDGVAYTLEARTVPQAVSFAQNGADDACVAFSSKDHGADAGDISPTLRAGGHARSHANAGAPPAIATSTVIRRVTPLECERLQGFPDNHTRIPECSFKVRPQSTHFNRYRDLYDELPDGSWVRHMADGPRYKLCGNSMAVPVIRWVGRRIQAVEDFIRELELAA